MNSGLNLNIKSSLIITIILAMVLASTYGITSLENGFLIAGVIIAAAVGVYSLINYKFGFYLAIVLGFLVFHVGRMMGQAFPSAFIIDMQIMTSFGGLLVHKVVNKEPFFKNANHIITYSYLIYTLFLIIEIFNPAMNSVEGWFLIIRKFLQFGMIYFIALNMFKTIKDIRFFMNFWIICALVAGMYGCYQEWFGFFDFEMDWIFSVPGRAGLYSLDNGNFRKFSILSGPAAYGIIMSACSLLFAILAMHEKKFFKKIILFGCTTFVVLGMAYAGTRTGYFIFVAGIVLYILMTITNKTSLIVACLFIMAFIIIMFGPIYGNATVNRIRTTFDTEDASLEVRNENRKLIQPYIHSHPIGSGLATTGIQGLQYNPYHFLAGFPPDSGFMKTAIETGWVGFLFQCSLYCIILLAGIKVFYRTNNKIIKKYCLATVVVIFAFVISQYGQVSVGQIPDCFLFYTLLAVIVSLDRLKETELKELK